MKPAVKALTINDVLRLVSSARDGKDLRVLMAMVHQNLSALSQSFHQKSEVQKSYIAQRFHKVARKGTLTQKLLALSVLQAIMQRYGPLPALSRSLRASAHDLTIGALYHAWHAFFALGFAGQTQLSDFERIKHDFHCRLIYKTLLEAAQLRWGEALGFRGDAHPRRIALCTTQFLGQRHAPTSNMLAMAKALVLMGYEVLIANQCLTPRQTLSGFYNPYVAPKFEQLNAIKEIDLGEGKHASFWQNPDDLPAEKGFAGFKSAVETFRPSRLISLGPGNLYADLLGDHIPHISMPTTANLTVGCPGTFGAVAAVPPLQQRLFARLGIYPDQVVLLPNAVRKPETDGPIPRERFGLQADDFAICVVSNRLDLEMSSDFAQRLESFLENHQHAKVIFFGAPAEAHNTRSRIIDRHPRLHFAGFQKDLFGAVAQFDAYLNLPRHGGGVSAAYALGNGVPVFTLGQGDVASMAGPPFVFDTSDHLFAALSKAARAERDGKEQSAAATERWAEVSDINAQLSALLQGAERLAA